MPSNTSQCGQNEWNSQTERFAEIIFNGRKSKYLEVHLYTRRRNETIRKIIDNTRIFRISSFCASITTIQSNTFIFPSLHPSLKFSIFLNAYYVCVLG